MIVNVPFWQPLEYYLMLIASSSFTVWFFIWLGTGAMLKLGRSKTAYKKLKKSLPIWHKILKINYVKLTKAYVGYQKFFVIMSYIGYALILIFIIICLISLSKNNFNEIFQLFILFKGFLIEIPALIFVFFNLCRTKDKRGFEWKFTRDYRNKKKGNHYFQ